MRWKQAWEKNERALKSFTAEFKQFVSAHIPVHFVLHFELSPIATQFSSHCGPGDESYLLSWASSSWSFRHSIFFRRKTFSVPLLTLNLLHSRAPMLYASKHHLYKVLDHYLLSHTFSLVKSSQPGRPPFVVPSFVTTFAATNPSITLLETNTSLASVQLAVSSDSPVFCQWAWHFPDSSQVG